MKDDYTANSHYLTYTFPFERLGVFYERGNEREYELWKLSSARHFVQQLLS